MRKLWTPDELAFMRQHYPHLPSYRVAAELQRSVKSVYAQATIMNLKKSNTYLASPFSGRLKPGTNLGGKTKFSKGQHAWNKGKKMGAEWNKGRMTQTQFKKGFEPHNTLHDGAIVIRRERTGRKVKLIRLAKAQWQYLSVHTWQQHHGPVPPGLIVAFKDRNSMNCTIENLELIDRAENMRRNTIHRYPEDLKKTIRTISKLKRTIQNHEKQDH
jgi:hypothetical protein